MGKPAPRISQCSVSSGIRPCEPENQKQILSPEQPGIMEMEHTHPLKSPQSLSCELSLS